MKLISMTQFVLQQIELENQNENANPFQLIKLIEGYANFLSLELHPGMFGPLKEDNSIYHKPDIDDFKGMPAGSFANAMVEYNRVCSHVYFKDFDVKQDPDNDEFSLLIKKKDDINLQVGYDVNEDVYTDSYGEWMTLCSIEDLARYCDNLTIKDVELTEHSQKIINGIKKIN